MGEEGEFIGNDIPTKPGPISLSPTCHHAAGESNRLGRSQEFLEAAPEHQKHFEQRVTVWGQAGEWQSSTILDFLDLGHDSLKGKLYFPARRSGGGSLRLPFSQTRF